MRIVTISLAVAATVLAQAPPTAIKAEFEVASVRRTVDDGNHHSDSDSGRYRAHNLTLKDLIAGSYDVDKSLVTGGPAWIGTDAFDINAKYPDELVHATRDQRAAMMSALLRDRFHLLVHRETRQISGYKLEIANRGPKLTRSKRDDTESSMNSNNRHLTATNVTMDALARFLSRNRDVGELVVDRTGLKERFDFVLDWNPEQPDGSKTVTADDLPRIFEALPAQLGLRVAAAKIPVEAVVVDRAEPPDAN